MLRKILPLSFYQQSTLDIAEQLIGKLLVVNSPDGQTIGRIVETEAYLGSDDLASHSAKGQNRRNQAMFMSAGTLYIYQIYGIHYCLNIVTAPAGQGEAVLIRAIEPLTGIELMQQRRPVKDLINLTNGPAKLVQAMAIDPTWNSQKIGPQTIEICQDQQYHHLEIRQSSRIGLSKATEKDWRFYLKNNPYITRHRFNR